MSLPTIVYRCPGPHQRPGGTFDFVGIETDEDLKEALLDGWFLTMDEAVNKKSAVALEEVKQEDDKPPTRAELEEMAEELNIKFDGRTSDKKLNELITSELD